MKVTLLAPRHLTADQFSAWDHLQSADGTVASPFFHPGFIRATAEVRADVEVAVLEQNGAVIGFFPFQRWGHVGVPVGGKLSDYHGLVLQPNVTLDVCDLLRQCNLSAWHFDHLPLAQRAFDVHHWRHTCSPCIELGGGLERYLADRQAAGSKVVSRLGQKQRKLEREVGPVRVEALVHTPHVLETLIKWKAGQYRRSGIFNPFQAPWIRTLFQNLLRHESPAFGGCMSALYVKDQLAAVFYFLRSHRVAHAWSTAYDPALARYSPGSILLLATIQMAPGLGIERIDLGKGDERYKQSFMSAAVPLAEGSVDLRYRTRALRHWLYDARQWINRSPLRRPLAIPWRAIKRELHRVHFH